MASGGESFPARAAAYLWGLSIGQKVLLGGALVLLFVGVQWYQDPRRTHGPMAPLFSGLEPEDATAISAKLTELKIHNEIDESGTAVRVPFAQVGPARLALASEGLPKGAGVGFEIFDGSDFGTSSFVQRTNYLRALQGELARTISALAEIESARVHLVLPEKSLLAARQEPARASVVLKLRPGRKLGERQLRGVVHLVSSAVEGLNAENVTVVDDKGELLSSGEGSDTAVAGVGGAGGGGGTFAFRSKYERETEERIETMLTRMVGPGHVVARVSAEFDFSAQHRVEERFDPQARAAKAESRSLSLSDLPGGKSGGAPGARSKIAGAAVALSDSAGNVNMSESSTAQYEVSHVTSTVVGGGATLERLSIAVVVDAAGDLSSAVTGTAGAAVASTGAGLPDVAMLTDLVKNTVGFNEQRGDRISVAVAPFNNQAAAVGGAVAESVPPPERPKAWNSPENLTAGIGVGIGLLSIAFSITAGVRRQRPALVRAAGGAVIAAPAQAQQPAIAAAPQQTQESLRRATAAEPERAAQALRSWLQG